jgi:hypothetical protein
VAENVIHNLEWFPKLSREVFSDDNIACAIAECAALFPV